MAIWVSVAHSFAIAYSKITSFHMMNRCCYFRCSLLQKTPWCTVSSGFIVTNPREPSDVFCCWSREPSDVFCCISRERSDVFCCISRERSDALCCLIKQYIERTQRRSLLSDLTLYRENPVMFSVVWFNNVSREASDVLCCLISGKKHKKNTHKKTAMIILLMICRKWQRITE